MSNTDTQVSCDVERTLRDIERFQEVVNQWDPAQIATVGAYKQAMDELHAEVFRRLIRKLKTNEVALSVLKEAVEDDLVYSILRHHKIIKPSLQERVETALQTVRPMLATHGGERRVSACGASRNSRSAFYWGV